MIEAVVMESYTYSIYLFGAAYVNFVEGVFSTWAPTSSHDYPERMFEGLSPETNHSYI